MRARREVTISVICALLVACSAAASAPDESHEPTVEGVGILPGSNPDAMVFSIDTNSTAPLAAVTTTTLTSQPAIGSLVTGNRLLMIGDSITASAAKRYGGEFCQALVPLGWQVEVDAEPSRFVDFGNAVLDKRLSAKWDAAYVFLGSNYLGDQESYRKQLEKIVQRLSPSPVVLLTVTEFEDNRREVNDAITLVSAEFPNVHLLDWGSIAAANADTILRGDGLHLTNDGRSVLASTIAGVLGQAPIPQGDCLSTPFSNDSGLSVNGSDRPSKKKVGGTTPTTVKSPTVTTVGGGGSATTKPPATVAPTPTTPPPTTPPPPPPPP
ncbi:MAG: hypothetical protein JJD93_00575, partial [Ilumatobacteraceae bacterium]|nr:hypothetical protein [Ilumatobacteraceae bacterium]